MKSLDTVLQKKLNTQRT